MALTISIQFPWGRFHATPWERSANEADPEWPPSPWRLLRALYATWKDRCPDLDSAVVSEVLSALAAPPSFCLPEHRLGHTRHYLPDTTKRTGTDGSTDKVLDAFVVLPRDEAVSLHWADVTLAPAAANALDQLLDRLSYLGRTESLCEAARSATPPRPLISPADATTTAPTVAVLLADEPLDAAKLVASTASLRRAGHLEPPGSRRVRYPLIGETTPRAPRPVARNRPTVAVFGATPSGGTGALPMATATLGMCELLRRTAQAKFGALNGGQSSPTLSGHDAASSPRGDQHQHAHFLALPTAGGRFVDRFAVWSPEGLGMQEVDALVVTRSLLLRGRGDAEGARDLRPVDLALEALGDLGVLEHRWTGPSKTWYSHTPFVTMRHVSAALRRRSEGAEDVFLAFLEAEVRREANLRGWTVERIAPTGPPSVGRWLDYRRHRAFKGIDRRATAPRGAGFAITFSEKVTGPVVLGSLSHLGLGLFVSHLEDEP